MKEYLSALVLIIDAFAIVAVLGGLYGTFWLVAHTIEGLGPR